MLIAPSPVRAESLFAPRLRAMTVGSVALVSLLAFEALAQHGLKVSVVGPRVGQASGLKMCYAASTKGTTALWTQLMTAARALAPRPRPPLTWSSRIRSN